MLGHFGQPEKFCQIKYTGLDNFKDYKDFLMAWTACSAKKLSEIVGSPLHTLVLVERERRS